MKKLTSNYISTFLSDLNGRSIPFRQLGFLTLHHLLDAIPDTIDAYQAYDGGIILFAKGTDETRHIESLVARQKKTGRVGRFGGVIQKPPEECHGTNERRQMVTKRILILTAKQPPNFIKCSDLFDWYEDQYGEKLDPRDDFNCTAKTLFEVKLGNYFEIKDTGRGTFWIRLKDAERENVLTGGGGRASSRPSTPGFPQGKFVEPPKSAPPTGNFPEGKFVGAAKPEQPAPNLTPPPMEAFTYENSMPVSTDERKRLGKSIF